MNSERLSLDQRRALAVFAFQMMMADHTAAAPETHRVDWLERELGVAGTIAPADYLAEPSLALFPDPQTRLVLLAELCIVAIADGHRHPDEIALLQRLAATFGIARGVINDLAAWAALPGESRPPLSQAVTSA